jgi:butyryl-CoA dehydrogenase
MGYKVSEFGADILTDIGTFCEREVKERSVAADHAHTFPAEMYEAAAEMGLSSLAVPEVCGGPGLTLQEQAACIEKAAWYDGGLAASLLTDNLAAGCVFRYAGEEVRSLCSEALLAGRSGAFCLTEENAGSDIGGIKTAAVPEGDGYRISGVKKFVSNAGIAGFFVVFAKMEEGLTAFFVPAQTPGISIGAEEDKLGIRTCSTCEVAFTDVTVPAAMMIGTAGEGTRIAMAALTSGRAFCGAAAAGLAQRALDEAIGYSKEREQFGGPLAGNPVIRAKLADMYMKTLAAQQACRHAFELLEQGEDAVTEAAAAKCLAGDAAVYCANEALQIFGGNGYCEAYPAEKLLRDARAFQIVEGANEIQRQLIGGRLVK